MEFKGTKGKWKITDNTTSIIQSGCVNIASSFTLIGRVDESRLENESWLDMRKRTEQQRIDCNIEQQANAKLISCAPEMLEMLIKAKNTLKDVYDCNVEEIEQLIKKATELC